MTAPKLSISQLFGLVVLLCIAAVYGSLNSQAWLEAHAQKAQEVLIPVWPAVPLVASNSALPVLSASAVIALDVDSGIVLYEKSADLPLPPASSLKLLTALTARELFSLDEIASVGAYTFQDARQPLSEGMAVSIRELLAALLVQSNNTAAYVLADHDALGLAHFVGRMNDIAGRIGLSNTIAFNPAGFDDELSRSSARNLSSIFRLAWSDPVLAELLATKKVTLYDNQGISLGSVLNTNQLLGVDQRVIAGKTGTTDEAGQVLVTLVSIDDHDVVLVVMGSQDRYSETRLLVDWLEEQYTWVQPNPVAPLTDLPVLALPTFDKLQVASAAAHMKE